MQILSRQESPTTAHEADTLCQLVEAHAPTLRQGSAGKTFRLSGTSFHLLQLGRNAVYRVERNSRWFLKLHCKGKNDGIAREILGFQFMRDHFNHLEAYYHPAAVRASLDAAYTLCSEIPGQQLNHALYALSLRPRTVDVRKTAAQFYRCGQMLAHLHRSGTHYEAPAVLNRQEGTLRRRLDKLQTRDTLATQIAQWCDTHRPEDAEETLIHGNCTFRNILVQATTLSFLDFETCGKDSRYHDLSRVCSDVLLCRTALLFPWKRAFAALAAFLQGYRAMYPYQPATLMQCIAMYIFERYLQVYCIKGERESIAGFPVLRSRFTWLVQRLLQGDCPAVFDTVAV